jgi:hypothetical protein
MAGDLLYSQEGLCSIELGSTKVQDRNLKPDPNSPRELVVMQTKKNVPCDLYFSIRTSVNAVACILYREMFTKILEPGGLQ